MKTASFKDLIVWQKSRMLVKMVYGVCATLPKSEEYGICSQARRSSVSIPSNIAEGYRRRNLKEYLQFLGIAAGSSAELETQLILIEDIYNVSTKIELDLLDEVQKMLMSMQIKMRQD